VKNRWNLGREGESRRWAKRVDCWAPRVSVGCSERWCGVRLVSKLFGKVSRVTRWPKSSWALILLGPARRPGTPLAERLRGFVVMNFSVLLTSVQYYVRTGETLSWVHLRWPGSRVDYRCNLAHCMNRSTRLSSTSYPYSNTEDTQRCSPGSGSVWLMTRLYHASQERNGFRQWVLVTTYLLWWNVAVSESVVCTHVSCYSRPCETDTERLFRSQEARVWHPVRNAHVKLPT